MKQSVERAKSGRAVRDRSTKEKGTQIMILTFQDIVDNISDTMIELTGEEVVDLHNKVCSRKIKYTEDSTWEYTGDNDNDN